MSKAELLLHIQICRRDWLIGYNILGMTRYHKLIAGLYQKLRLSYILHHYQKTVKLLTWQEIMLGMRPDNIFPLTAEERLIYNPDRWGKPVVEKNMFPVLPLIRWVDRLLFRNPYLIGGFYAFIVLYVLLMYLIPKS